MPVVSDLYTMIWRYCNAPVVTVSLLFLLAAAGIKRLFQWRKPFHPDLKKVVILIWFFFPYLFMFSISYILPVFLDRYTVFISLPFYLMVGLALEELFGKKQIWAVMALITLVLMAVTFTPDVDNKRRIKELVARAKDLKTDRSVVILCPEWLVYGYAYHASRDIFSDYLHFRERLHKARIKPANGMAGMDTTFLRNASDVIFIEEWSSLVDKEGDIRKFLGGHFRESGSWNVYESFTLTDFKK